MNDVRNDVAKLMGSTQEISPEPSASTGDIKAGDLVSIKTNAIYYNGAAVPKWVLGQRWYVESVSVSSDRVIINKSENGQYSIMSAISKEYLVPIYSTQTELAATEPITPEPTPQPVENVAAVNPEDAEETAWNFLRRMLGNDYAVAGVMGNLYAESGLCSYNLQNVYEKSLGMTDAEYTLAVDNGSYSKDSFVNDKAGYGLAQWTFYARKGSLYDFAKECGKSIGDMQMQLDFLWKELLSAKFLEDLKCSASVLEASNIILTQYERPADQSEAVQIKRAEYGHRYYEKYHIVPDVSDNAQPSEQAAIDPDEFSDGTYFHSHEEAQNFLLRLLNHIVDFIVKSFAKKE